MNVHHGRIVTDGSMSKKRRKPKNKELSEDQTKYKNPPQHFNQIFLFHFVFIIKLIGHFKNPAESSKGLFIEK